jgi:hypothetical protein
LSEWVMMELLPQLQTRWLSRQQRKLPVSLSWAQRYFQRIWVVDGSTLEAIFRKLHSLQDQPVSLGGKIYTIVDLITHLPVAIQLSLEMLFRGFYHFNHAYSRGKASDPIAYFSAKENQDLRIVKYEHKSRIRQQLNLSAYPT